jgi:hypothetical protein
MNSIYGIEKREQEKIKTQIYMHATEICLRLQECSYISIYDLGLQHNIFI